MSNTLVSTLVNVAAEAEHHEKVNHWVFGAVAIVILVGVLLALIAFGGGREHS
jgi:hypothetical protein